jgi:hypothetical protein
MYLLLQCGHAGTALLLSDPSQSVTANYVRLSSGLDAESRLPYSAGHRISPVPAFKLWDSEEERDCPAPSPGCRVLPPFPRHSPAILCIVPHRICSLLHTPANFSQQSEQPAPPLLATLHSSTRTAPVSSPQLGHENEASRECVLI